MNYKRIYSISLPILLLVSAQVLATHVRRSHSTICTQFLYTYSIMDVVGLMVDSFNGRDQGDGSLNTKCIMTWRLRSKYLITDVAGLKVDGFNGHDQGDRMCLFHNSIEGYPQFEYQMYYDLTASEQVFNYGFCRAHGWWLQREWPGRWNVHLS